MVAPSCLGVDDEFEAGEPEAEEELEVAARPR
jgi:hypothetical protein